MACVLGDDVSIRNLATMINLGRIRKIVVKCGAGISVSAGIPDFRSPKTGLYHNLQKYNLDDPTGFFIANICRFFTSARPTWTLSVCMLENLYKIVTRKWLSSYRYIRY